MSREMNVKISLRSILNDYCDSYKEIAEVIDYLFHSDPTPDLDDEIKLMHRNTVKALIYLGIAAQRELKKRNKLILEKGLNPKDY